jgi:hypothetical protein
MAEYLGKIKWGSVSYMTKRQRWWFLAKNHEMSISTVDEKGVIFSSPCWYVVKDERVFVTFDQASRHVDNTRTGSGATGVVYQGGDEFCTPRGVTIQGRLEFVSDPVFSEQVSYLLADKVLGPDHPDYDTYIEFREFYDHLIGELIIENVITWDGRRVYYLQSYSKRTRAPKSEAAIDQRHQRPELITEADTHKLPMWEFTKGCNTYIRVSTEMQGCVSGMQGWTEQAADMEPLTWKQASWDEIFYCVKGIIRLVAEDAKGSKEEIVAKEGETIYVPGGYIYTLLPSGVDTVNLWSAHPVAHRGLVVMRDVGFPHAREVSDRLKHMARERRETARGE